LDLFSQKQYDDEIAFLNGYLSRDSSDAYAFFLRALALFEAGEYQFVEAHLLTRSTLSRNSPQRTVCDASRAMSSETTRKRKATAIWHCELIRLIRSICVKAGVPNHDRKGRFTVHRARSTIATQLANAKEPMSP